MKFKLAFLAVIALFSGCSVFKASPAPDTGFLPHEDQLAPLTERSPFNAVWYADKKKFYDLKKEYHQMVILPVDTTYLEYKIRGEKISDDSKKDDIEDIREIAKYARNRLIGAMKMYPNNPISIVDDVGPKTFAFEMSIVELQSTSQVINTLGTAAGIFIPGADVIKYAASGSIAMEALIRDGETGDILVEIKDREADKSAPFSVKDFQQYGHARRTIDEWAEIFAELAATPYEHTVEGLFPFTFNPF